MNYLFFISSAIYIIILLVLFFRLHRIMKKMLVISPVNKPVSLTPKGVFACGEVEYDEKRPSDNDLTGYIFEVLTEYIKDNKLIIMYNPENDSLEFKQITN